MAETMTAVDGNEKNLLKVRQAAFIMLAFSPAVKLVFLPSVMAEVASEQLWLPLLTSFLIEGILIALILVLFEKRGYKTFFKCLEESFGSVAARAIYFFIAVFLVLKSLLPIFEHKLYIENTIYEMSPDRITFYIFFAFSTYLSVQGVKILGRAADIAVVFTLLGLLTAFGLSVGAADYSNLLPIIKKPAYNLVNAIFRPVVWQGDAVYIILFSGHFRPEKGYKKKILSGYTVGALATILFSATLYGIYGAITPSQNYALPSMSVFSVIVTNIGRFDFLSIFLLLFSQVFAVSMPLMLAVKCLERAFSLKNSIVAAIAVNAAVLIVTAIFSGSVFELLKLSTDVLCYCYAAFVAFSVLIVAITKKAVKNEI